MAAEEKTAGRGTIATIVATAAVTMAIGVTVAALGGYLAPARDRAQTATAAQPTVVFVPVAPDGRGEPATTVPAPQGPEVLLAAYETAEHDDDDHHPSREHHQDDHGHDD